MATEKRTKQDYLKEIEVIVGQAEADLSVKGFWEFMDELRNSVIVTINLNKRSSMFME